MIFRRDFASHADLEGPSTGGSAGGDSWVSSPVTLALICAPVFWRCSVFCCGEDWNWIAGIAGSISGISSRIWCCWNLKFSSRISCRIYTTETWMSPWNSGVSLSPHGTSLDRGMTSVDLRLDCLVYMAEKCAEFWSVRASELWPIFRPKSPKSASVAMCWWMLVRNICLYIPLPLYQRYVWYVPFMIYFPISFSHKIPLDPIKPNQFLWIPHWLSHWIP